MISIKTHQSIMSLAGETFTKTNYSLDYIKCSIDTFFLVLIYTITLI